MLELLSQACSRVAQAIGTLDCHPSQRALLQATTDRLEAACLREPLHDPLSLAGLVAAAWGREVDDQASEVGAFCLLYVGALDLLDDVQDDDLAGKPHQDAGAAIATNSAITLLFLALDALRRAIELEPDNARQLEYLRLFNRVSLTAAKGQHVDLMGAAGAQSPDDVLAMQQAKTSSVALVAECGALLGRCDDAARGQYRLLGERLALVVQIVDDLRDIFGKDTSPDLRTGKITYPIACFLADASNEQRQQFDELVGQLPGSLGQLRELLYDAGVVEQCALALERYRYEIHQAVVATGNGSAYHRVLLTVVDDLAGSIYEPDPVAESAHLWQPRGGWHDRVHEAREQFSARMRPFGLPDPPPVEPWHLPYYLYVPDRRIIRYPDLEELGAELLSVQAELLGTTDLAAGSRIMQQQLPVVFAHEMFHFWRHAAGRITDDVWHEEYAANRLAVGYARRFCPDALASGLSLAQSVRERFAGALDERAEAILRGCATYRCGGGYGMDMKQAAIVHMEMITRLAAAFPDFESDLGGLLGPPPASDAATAPAR